MQREVLLVGSPNVGKSVIFNYLTGSYVNVSNYPGTTVEVSRGFAIINGLHSEIVDTPGIYSLIPLTDEERVTRELLFRKRPDVIVHVTDAKNIRRMLAMTLELLDAGLPVVLNLNIMDEAVAAGMKINTELLSERLGIPVIPTAAAKKLGLEQLKGAIGSYQFREPIGFRFSAAIENAIAAIGGRLTGGYPLANRMMALLLLQNDAAARMLIAQERHYLKILEDIEKAASAYGGQPLAQVIAAERQNMVNQILVGVIAAGKPRRRLLANALDRLTREPLTGIPLLLLVLYLGLYKFVGGFGAGYLVDFIDTNLFERILNPALTYTVDRYIPWEWLSSLLVGDYGVFTLGLRYAVAIILPIVGTFFLTFAVLEDSGYLPRLAMLMDNVFKAFGLNGRAVIPITLGLGCGTMAVMVTRTLATKRERLIATFLLSLAIPCSAQLGLVMALLSQNVTALLIWAGCLLTVFALAGCLAAQLLPGKRSPFYIELPPLRLPAITNVLTKAYVRMIWYFVEIIPVFIFASLILWAGDRTGILAYTIEKLRPLMNVLGLPPETAQVFLLGFFRRDYGAAGLYDMVLNGLLDSRQLLVSAVTLTLFVPCVAQFMVMIKERGAMAACLMFVIITVIAFLAGWTVNEITFSLPIGIWG